MRPVSVAAIRSGEDNPLHQSALVEDVTGRTWVVRSPLTPAAGAELERNDDLVRQLGKHLPFKVPAAAGYADLGPDGRAAVYPFVEGLALSLRHLPVGPGLASAVGRAIAAVHNMPRELFEEFAVPVFDAGPFRDRKLSELDRAAETGHVPNGLLARWEQALDAAPLWRFATVPTHGSLDGESFLVAFSDETDSASGRVVGLTGWERAQVADPAEDFARLVEVANPRAVDAVFDSYSIARSQRPDGYLLSRARLASEMRLLNGLAAAVGSGDEQFIRHRADELRKLDRLTANDDSLIPRTALAPVAAESELAVDESWDAADASATDGPGAPTTAVEDACTTDVVDGTDDEAAFEVEAPAEGAHLEPVTPPETQVSAADVTAPIPMFRPVSADTEIEEVVGPETSEADDVDGPEVTESDDVEGPEVTEAETTEGVAEGEVGTDEADAEGGGPGEQAATDETPSPDGADADETGTDETTADGEAETDADDTDGDGKGTDSPHADGPDTERPDTGTLPVTEAATGGEDAEDSERADRAAEERERADRAAEERLHTIYGMPEAADLEPPESGGR
nr:phosphotransferase [Ornithinimicrobium sp. F0845]